MKRRALYLIVVVALVLGMALPVATSVMASGIGGNKTTVQNPGDPQHPVDRYVIGQTIYYSLMIDNRSSTEDMIVKIRDRIPLDPATGDEIPGVTTTYWWNNDTSQWVLSDPDTPVTIPPDESWYGTFEYEIIEDGVLKHPVLDIDVWVNELLASGTQGPDTVNYAQAKTVRVIQPGIELQKDVTPGVAEVGQNVTYTFTITNTGDWPLENITIEDDKLPDPDLQAEIPGDLVLAEHGEEGDSHTFTYEYTIQEGDLPLENTATVWGTAEGFDPAIVGAEVNDTDDAEVTLDADPSIAIEKAVWDGEGWDDADLSTGPHLPSTENPVVFRFIITNDGNVPLTNVALSDTHMSDFYTDMGLSTLALFPIATLAAGMSETFYGSLTWAAGQHSNTATATGTPPDEPAIQASDDCHYFGVGPSIDLQKAVWEGGDWDDADTPPGPYLPDSVDPVVFRFTITNDGNVPLSNVTLSDTHMSDFYTDQGLTIAATFPIATLAAGMSETFYGSLPWTAGQHSNNATATGTPADEPDVSAGDDCHYFGSAASIDIKKAVWDGADWHDADTAPTGPELKSSQDPVIFRFIITNDGNSPLNNVTLSDTHMSDFYTDQGLTTAATFPIATLAANVSATFYGSLDWAIGQHSNTATATGTPPDEPAISASNDCHYFGVGASIDMQKSVWDGTTWRDADTPTGPYLSDSVDPVVFRFTITNTGNVPLSNVTLSETHMSDFYTDQGLTTAATFPIATLAAGMSETFYGSLGWTAGQHSNTATATGTPPDDPAIQASDDCHYLGRTPPDITVGWDGQSVNKVAVLAPWIALMMGTIACAVLFMRRRQAQG